jgi:DNA-binding transcriptional regulator YhcF (GntR family)
MTAATATPTNEQVVGRNEKKWGKPLMAAGWTAIPSVILDRQQALGLDALDVNILLQLAKHWWESDNPPFPSKKALSDCIGVDPRTIQRRIQQLEKDGLIKRKARKNAVGGCGSNAYLFDGLVKAATPFAHEALQKRAEREKAKEETRKRRRPQLKAVPAPEEGL